MLAQAARDPHRVLRVRAHPVRQRVDAAQRQPAIERRGHRAAIMLRAPRALEQVIVVPRDQRAADHVAVAADVLRGGVRHHVDAAVERPLQDRRRERAVADRDRVRPGPRARSAAIAARSVIFISGFDGVSTQTSRVFGRIAARTSSRLRHIHVRWSPAPTCRRRRRSPCAVPSRRRRAR